MKIKPSDALTVLGSERLVPGEDAYQELWHKSRYAWAARFAVGLRILDAGSGEGYGAAFLAGVADSVLGVDYSQLAIEHARSKYASPNLDYEVADLADFKGADGPFDLITCFEAIEHVEDHDCVLSAFAGRLAVGGRLILSTPNVLYHGPGSTDLNPYHLHEVSHAELAHAGARHFGKVRVVGQIGKHEVPRAIAKLIVDPFYQRRRLGRPQPAPPESAVGAGDGVAVPPRTPRDFVFSRVLARVSPVAILLATKTK